MKKKPLLIVALMAIMLFSLGQTVMAFSDVSKDPNADKINALQEKGILSGYAGGEFKPNGTLTYASAVSMIVKGLDLNIDHVRFIRMPLASDNHPNLEDDAWYSQAFVIADFYGLDIPKDVKAGDKITKEQYAHHLFKAMMTKGDYAFIEIFMLLNDEADVDAKYMDSIQKLLISKIASLDKKNNFYPKKAITRGEAAGWLYDAIKFVKEQTPIEPEPELPAYDLKLNVEAVNADVNKVTVTGQMPNPGYGLRIASISFEGDKAVLNVEAVQPDPDKMYPQVITEVKVSTFVDAKLKPVLAESMSSSSSTGSPDASVSSEE
ncbi:S-layer homology domain-containing protein [Paenibacillus sp. LHD-117]|uniref:S-layer homology domain-containing protein n=1 Tax=Paenibacillus sp. LHD-117 TaxID=3071412 RepID=UPI0027DF1C2D|nr:S-layer homology domain-containing protein [Paenibacillus sp. LHD-117]MDQ6420900.1 S-layer homology domain-containing protein [Paenibacillus sp. LHD-117]